MSRPEFGYIVSPVPYPCRSLAAVWSVLGFAFGLVYLVVLVVNFVWFLLAVWSGHGHNTVRKTKASNQERNGQQRM